MYLKAAQQHTLLSSSEEPDRQTLRLPHIAKRHLRERNKRSIRGRSHTAVKIGGRSKKPNKACGMSHKSETRPLQKKVLDCLIWLPFCGEEAWIKVPCSKSLAQILASSLAKFVTTLWKAERAVSQAHPASLEEPSMHHLL